MAMQLPQVELGESLEEQKQGGAFLELIWDSGKVIEDIESDYYLKNLGQELLTYSNNPEKHIDLLFLDDNSINAFAGSYGYIGVHSGLLFTTDSESELAGVVAHEIAHVTQNHLLRFNQKSDKQTYIMAAGILLSALLDNPDASQAVAASTVAGTAQQNINFTREHEWEADRIGTNMLSKSGFNPEGMARFFEKLKDNTSAEEFLRTHPLSINRVADSIARASRTKSQHRPNSFAYKTIKARFYYHQHKRIESGQDLALNHYMQAYQAFDQQNYQQAIIHVRELLEISNEPESYILAGRIFAKLADMDTASSYFENNQEHEPSIYYWAQAYLQNNQPRQGISLLKPYLRLHEGSAISHQLLASLYVKQGALDRSHMHTAKSLVLKGKLSDAIDHYQRAKTLTRSQDLFDVIDASIAKLQKTLSLYQGLD